MFRVAVAALLLGCGVAPAMAANADQPYKNVDKRNDSGNDTGDSRVDGLNRAQLDENQKGGLGQPSATAPAVPASGPARPDGATPAPR